METYTKTSMYDEVRLKGCQEISNTKRSNNFYEVHEYLTTNVSVVFYAVVCLVFIVFPKIVETHGDGTVKTN